MEVNLEIAPGCYIHNVFFVVVVPVNIKTGCNSFAVLRNRVVYIYTCWNPQVTWEQIKVGQAALVVPNSHYWNVEGKKKKKQDVPCERIISVTPHENCSMKTISLISAGLINSVPNV